ncbi:AraC family transcriptional regulator [Pleomorphomonas diazotrophica]|uniref:AraC family transcriptional regulator n=1 Tax=Pleomorphomonas diazotrophica TaxID=1166257 RepID=A0A1I4UP01_9HYPH|nr:helix-turn-helix transcriptional regulator [Pleomorphomonas diazotrophica]PKR88406.1 AraC family transcriptional regulator [Pleomorphomonas diazotrophica]SFM90702.1 AraC-type DNA-binding protein [Pleomorphomonas diazotrophica]
MPILDVNSLPQDWMDPDLVPRPVVTYGFVADHSAEFEMSTHSHIKAQLILVRRGALSCEVEGDLWIVPPRSAIWVPAGALHSVKMSGVLEGYNAFIQPYAAEGLPPACRTVSVSPLLDELMARAARLPSLYEEGGANSRLMAVLIDEIVAAKVEDLNLPLPADPCLRRLAEAMLAAPADRSTLDVWAKRAGLSERTLARRIGEETGMSFGRWRQRLAVMLAVKWLAGGASIQKVAADLGYESVPSFVTMFRKTLGTSPGRYMAERYGGG